MCVSGSPISTPSHSPLPRTSSSTPVHMKSSPSVINNPYIIVDKPGQVINMATSAATGTCIFQDAASFSEIYHSISVTVRTEK